MSQQDAEIEENEEINAEEQQESQEQFDFVIDKEEGEEESQPAPSWVRDLRKEYREVSKKAKDLERELEELRKPKITGLGEKPTLESCEYDSDEYERQLDEWYSKKKEHDAVVEKQQSEQQKAEAEWQARQAIYQDERAKMKVSDFDEAEGIAKTILDASQQGIIIHAAKNPAMVAYALGKNITSAERLAAIKDPIKFGIAMSEFERRLEDEMVRPRTPGTKPEKRPEGTGGAGGSVDSALDRLREEAAKTGDYTKVVAYKKEKRGS